MRRAAAGAERAGSGDPLGAVLAGGGIAVLHAPLSVSAALRDKLFATLDGAEQARVGSFRDPELGDRFAVGRGTLRSVLASLRETTPQEVRFGLGPAGKPHLADAAGVPPLEFNLSHAGDRLAVALSTRGPVGIDIEEVQPLPDADDLARKILTDAERRALAALPAGRRARALLVAWVRKEACLKALGVGLSVPPARFGLTTLGEPGDDGAAVPDLGGAGDGWRLYALAPGDGYVGAVAAAGGPGRIATFDLVWHPSGDMVPRPRSDW